MKTIRSWYQLWSDRLDNFVNNEPWPAPDAAHLQHISQEMQEFTLEHLDTARQQAALEGFTWTGDLDQLRFLRNIGLNQVPAFFWHAVLAQADVRWVKVSLVIESA